MFNNKSLPEKGDNMSLYPVEDLVKCMSPEFWSLHDISLTQIKKKQIVTVY